MYNANGHKNFVLSQQSMLQVQECNEPIDLRLKRPVIVADSGRYGSEMHHNDSCDTPNSTASGDSGISTDELSATSNSDHHTNSDIPMIFSRQSSCNSQSIRNQYRLGAGGLQALQPSEQQYVAPQHLEQPTMLLPSMQQLLHSQHIEHLQERRQASFTVKQNLLRSKQDLLRSPVNSRGASLKPRRVVDTKLFTPSDNLKEFHKKTLMKIQTYHQNMVRKHPQKQRNSKDQERRDKNTIACRLSRRKDKLNGMLLESSIQEAKQEELHITEASLRAAAYLKELVVLGEAAPTATGTVDMANKQHTQKQLDDFLRFKMKDKASLVSFSVDHIIAIAGNPFNNGS